MTNQSANNPTSFSLLQRVRSNDQQAWNQLVQIYGPLVHRWCRRSGLNEDDTADVFQETFRAVARHVETFTPERKVGSFRSWLRTITRTKTVDHFRRRQKEMAGAGGTAAQLQLANFADPIPEDDETEEDAAEENAIVVQRAMELISAEFSARNWAAFQRVAIEGHSAVEVANELGINPQVIRQANYRIRRRLRLVLQDLGVDVK